MWLRLAVVAGGGYQYRLCPANSPLDEDCFQKRPLAFVGQASLRWGGPGGEQVWFDASDATVGTTPAGSAWRKCPIPRGPWGWVYNGPSFEPVCEETEACKALSSGRNPGDSRTYIPSFHRCVECVSVRPRHS